MATVLVINSGSSSGKYQLIDPATGHSLASGILERIGQDRGRALHETGGARFERECSLADHSAAFAEMLSAFAEHGPSLDELIAVGHRVVQGGARYREPALITGEVERHIAELAPLAPLHNPANLQGILAAREAFPDVPHVAVFDTAFHQTIPEAAYTYAIDAELAKRYGVRRYGFHGTSHRYVSRAAAEFISRPIHELNQIVFHLGNGASVCAIAGGKSLDVSMGMTPLEGLVMGSRSGDIDPAVLIYLARVAELSIDQLDHLLNADSGMRGLAGHSDMRDISAAADAGDHAAQLALDVYVHRAKGYLGNYFAKLGRLDLIAFTAGVGENAPSIRERICAGLEGWGIEIDPVANAVRSAYPRQISTPASRIKVLVVPTNEEAEIARQTIEAIGRAPQPSVGGDD